MSWQKNLSRKFIFAALLKKKGPLSIEQGSANDSLVQIIIYAVTSLAERLYFSGPLAKFFLPVERAPQKDQKRACANFLPITVNNQINNNCLKNWANLKA
jgi:hypothetical protein